MNTSACDDVRIVDGSVPTASHASTKRARCLAASSGAPQAFHSSAQRAVIRIILEPAVPTRIGSLSCTGWGSQGASVMV